MKIYFEDQNYNKILLGECKKLDEARAIWRPYVESRGYKIYYTRCWKEGKITTMDFGSHSEFVLIEED